MQLARRFVWGAAAAVMAFGVLAQATVVADVAPYRVIGTNSGSRIHVAPPVLPRAVRKSGATAVRGALRASRPLSVTGGAWSPVGPRLINTNGTDPEKWATGRITSLASTRVVHNTYTLYAGSGGGGVWKSSDKGLNWASLGSNTFKSLIIGAVAVDPHDPAVVYAGTGAAFQQDYGYGIYKSTNAGQTWTAVNGVAHDGSALFDGRAISNLVADPNTTGCPTTTRSCRIYASVVDVATGIDVGVTVSRNGGLTWSEPTGAGTLSGAAVTSLITDANGNLYAAVGSPSGRAGVWYSAFSPSKPASSWTRISNGLPGSGTYFQLAINLNTSWKSHSSQIVYVAVGNDNRGLLGVYRTSTGGIAGWTAIGIPPRAPYYHPNKDCPTKNAPPPQIPDFNAGNSGCDLDGQATFDLDLTAAGNSLYLGQVNLFKTDNALAKAPQWYDISNGYANVCRKLNPPPDYHQRSCAVVTHVDQHAALTVSTSPSPTTIFGNDGGVFLTPDGGRTFVNGNGATNAGSKNPQGTTVGLHPLMTTQMYGGGVTSDGKKLLIGLQDNGSILSTNAASSFNEVCCGDGAYSVINPSNTQIMYTEAPNGDVMKSVDGGTNFNDVPPPGDNAQFVAPLVMDPKNPSRLYSGQSHLWRTDNAAATWKSIGASGGTFGISAVAIAPSASGTIFVGAGDNNNNGDVWLTRNAMAAFPVWQRLTTSLPGPVTALAVDPSAPNVVYVAMDNINSGPGGFVYKGTVTGAVPHASVTWVNITHNLPNFTVRSIAVDSAHPQTLYAGGYNGAFASIDGGSTWKQLGTGLPNVQVFQFVQAHGRLYAFTYGRGTYSLPLPV
jgi:hypothetical protein